ncbi:MAG: VOC family protein [Paracoccaceae bacterium]
MQKVNGVGGFFFRAQDPAKLTEWYLEHLGISPVPQDADTKPWMQEAGPTAFAPFAADADYFAAEQAFMLNFRVDDLDGMIEQLKSSGIEVLHEIEMEGIGRFARVHDPEGNPIELWQPA